MWIGNWAEYKIDKPGNWFHGWTIPIFPRIIAEKQEALGFETFRHILSDLNEEAKVNGEIDKFKAEELYYHFLIQYFPDCPLISVLKERYFHPSVLGIGTNPLINEGGSLVWPPSSELPRQQVRSGDRYQTVQPRSGVSEHFEESPTMKEFTPEWPPRRFRSEESYRTVHRRSEESGHSEESTSDMSESVGIAGSPVVRITPNELEQLQWIDEKKAEMNVNINVQSREIKDDVNVQSNEVFSFGGDMAIDTPMAVNLGIPQDRQSRSKRKSSSDDTPMLPGSYGAAQRSPKRTKSDPDDTPIKNKPVDEEMLEMLNRMRNCTDTSMADYPLSEAGVLTAPGGPGDNSPLIPKEKCQEQIPVWLSPSHNPFPTLKQKREEKIPVWLSLVKAVNNARDELQGDDLELFERLIAKRNTPAEADELIQKWGDGELGIFEKLRAEAAKPFSWKEWAEQKNESYLLMSDFRGLSA